MIFCVHKKALWQLKINCWEMFLFSREDRRINFLRLVWQAKAPKWWKFGKIVSCDSINLMNFLEELGKSKSQHSIWRAGEFRTIYLTDSQKTTTKLFSRLFITKPILGRKKNKRSDFCRVEALSEKEIYSIKKNIRGMKTFCFLLIFTWAFELFMLN